MAFKFSNQQICCLDFRVKYFVHLIKNLLRPRSDKEIF